MFSNTARWQIKKEKVQLNHAPIGTKVPKLTLKDKLSSTTISLFPYRIIFDPYIPSDNYCCLDMRLNELDNFLQQLDGSEPYREKTATRCKWIFDMPDKNLSFCLDQIEDYLLQTTYGHHKNLTDEFNQLREFVNIASRKIYPSPDEDAINDKEMTYSAFGWRHRMRNGL